MALQGKLLADLDGTIQKLDVASCDTIAFFLRSGGYPLVYADDVLARSAPDTIDRGRYLPSEAQKLHLHCVESQLSPVARHGWDHGSDPFPLCIVFFRITQQGGSDVLSWLSVKQIDDDLL